MFKKTTKDGAAPWFVDWVDISGVGVKKDSGRRRNLSKLSRENPEAWNGEWQRIKKYYPQLAELMTKDTFFNELRTYFNADVLVELTPERDYDCEVINQVAATLLCGG